MDVKVPTQPSLPPGFAATLGTTPAQNLPVSLGISLGPGHTPASIPLREGMLPPEGTNGQSMLSGLDATSIANLAVAQPPDLSAACQVEVYTGRAGGEIYIPGWPIG